ncbi:MAG: hypothetical protein QM763_13300 [Agriterribacter sp.]
MFAQPTITYTYVEPDPQLEADKKAKKAYFKQLRDDAYTNWVNCNKQCGSHAADANNPDPCGKSDAINVCLCACGTRYQGLLSDINKREQDWLRTAAQRQKDYENKKIKEQQDALNKQNKAQQQQNLQSQQQAATQQKLNQIQEQFNQQQQRYQQTQMELENAKNASMNAYEAAISSGRKESGAMLDATFAGASQISDSKAALVYTGVGLGLSLAMRLSEKKAEKAQKEAERRAEYERTNLIVNTKNAFIKEALDLNKYSFSDLVSKDRYATILLIPKQFSADEDVVYFTYTVPVPKYSDGTYPLKPEVEKKLLLSIDRNIRDGKMVHTLYPITDLEKFNNDFVKKMGSGKVIFLNAQLLNVAGNPFSDNSAQKDNTDFWGNPVKKDDTKQSDKPTQQTKNNFWNN